MAGPGTERLGILGGTFDPIHVGHVAAAGAVHEALDLDRILFVVAGEPWQKQGMVVASAVDRLAMARAAVAGIDAYDVSEMEIERRGPTFSIDTVEALTRPGRELYLILGADAADRLPTWHRVEDIAKLVTLVLIDREGIVAATPGSHWRVERVRVPRVDVSSSDVRRLIGMGQSVDGLVPPAVAQTIAERCLYAADR